MAINNADILLKRLSRLIQLRELIIKMRRQGYLEQEDALNLIRLLREIIAELSDNKAKLTLKLIEVIEKIAHNPSTIAREYAYNHFGRDDIFLAPEHLVKALPNLTLFNKLLSNPLVRSIVRQFAENRGLNPQAIELLLDIRLQDLIAELGFIIENLLNIAEEYALELEEYIKKEGSRGLPLSGETLSALAEVTGRAWLSVVKAPLWEGAKPRIGKKFEFDAVKEISREYGFAIYVAEIESRCGKFLEQENNKETRIEGKTRRLRDLLRKIEESYKLEPGKRKICLEKFVLLCFDCPDDNVKNIK